MGPAVWPENETPAVGAYDLVAANAAAAPTLHTNAPYTSSFAPGERDMEDG